MTAICYTAPYRPVVARWVPIRVPIFAQKDAGLMYEGRRLAVVAAKVLKNRRRYRIGLWLRDGESQSATDLDQGGTAEGAHCCDGCPSWISLR